MQIRQEEARNRPRIEDLDLPSFIEQLSRRVTGPYSRLEPPHHLGRFTDLFERIERGETVLACASTPPQHGKTAVELYGAVRHLLRHPQHSVVFASYGADFSRERSADARQMIQATGMALATDKVTLWQTRERGSFMAVGVGGPLTGTPNVKLILVDDPHKGRTEAESKVDRNKVAAWFHGSVLARAHPDTSIIVTHTRWHKDDLIGRLTDQERADGKRRWEYANLEAIDAQGQALWPSKRPLEWLEERRADSEYEWWSMFMGSPRARGGSMFEDSYLYDRLPDRYRVAIGVDLAYTAKTHADWSVAVVMAEAEGNFYIVDVVRRQVPAPVFAEQLKLLSERYPGAKMLGYAYGSELGTYDFLRAQGIKIKGKSMTGDKVVRATSVSAAWRRGRVFVPRCRGSLDQDLPEDLANKPVPWVAEYLSELLNFSGVNDPHDDQVDATAPAYDALRRTPGPATGSAFVGTPTDFDRPSL